MPQLTINEERRRKRWATPTQVRHRGKILLLMHIWSSRQDALRSVEFSRDMGHPSMLRKVTINYPIAREMFGPTAWGSFRTPGTLPSSPLGIAQRREKVRRVKGGR